MRATLRRVTVAGPPPAASKAVTGDEVASSPPTPPRASLLLPAAARCSQAERRAPPLLASEALREDIAPLEPAPRLARLVCLGAAIVLVLLSFAMVMEPSGARSTSLGLVEGLASSAVLVWLTAARVRYLTRALSMAGLGLLILIEGFLGRGPAFGLVRGQSDWLGEAAHAAAAIVLPAALLFRARYRAYPVARVFLACALAVGLPWLVVSARDVVGTTNPAAWGVTAAAIGVTLLSLVGFMGAGTTGMGSVWAAALLVLFSLDIAARQIAPGAQGLGALICSAAFLAASSLAALGVFQATAALLAPDARRIDTRAHAEETPERGASDGAD